MLLIAGLLWQRARKRKAEAILRESEKRFRVITETTPALVWLCDILGKIIYRNQRRMAFTRLDQTVEFSDTWASFVHPDDVQNLLEMVSQALKIKSRFRRSIVYAAPMECIAGCSTLPLRESMEMERLPDLSGRLLM